MSPVTRAISTGIGERVTGWSHSLEWARQRNSIYRTHGNSREKVACGWTCWWLGRCRVGGF